ncbi:UvrD-helicase domain-containing protein [Streptomyces sp. NRRL F-5650]|uniref:UvrD-helicase domain-containing protein n=1 Tax=Streptomyces sp. NRRL F-5650 TaxID=1463868 RepID=UPI00099CE95A|nr:UvrD-helicase domain-containing protein [Streptomyces sp. NRRL F-5650]
MSSRLATPDTSSDVRLRELLDAEQLRCFAVVAGAGSGKTTSLVKALDHVAKRHGSRLRARTQQIACITYTEVAAREIHADVGNSALVEVSTIHSFLWSLVLPFQRDISQWVRHHLEASIERLKEKQSSYSSRTQKKTVEKDAADLDRLRRQLREVAGIERFRYGVGSDYAKGVLGHEDIVTMTPELVMQSRLLRRIVANKYPYIFVDESQDTFPGVVDALKLVARQEKGALCLGFFGDPMQQIYQRGVGEITMEEDWVRIEKRENFRSSNAVLSVINQVRSKADGLRQVSGRRTEEQVEGECFFFVLPADDRRSERLEQVRSWLGRHSEAGSWLADSTDDGDGAKILMIVHRMVAKRMGFEELYTAFHDGDSKSLKLAFDEGAAWPLRPFEEVILPICAAESVDSPAVIAVLREQSRVFSPEDPDADVRKSLNLARDVAERVREIMAQGGPGSVGTALRLSAESGLIDPDPRLSVYFEPNGEHSDTVLTSDTRTVLDSFSACDARQVEMYFKYILKQSPYSTQHGTKGSEFSKVVVVLDDEEGQYRLYSYEKLFGIKPLSDTDERNLSSGKESVLERTRRLLYVCVSRARDALAVVVFADDVTAAVTAIEDAIMLPNGRVLIDDDLAL